MAHMLQQQRVLCDSSSRCVRRQQLQCPAVHRRAGRVARTQRIHIVAAASKLENVPLFSDSSLLGPSTSTATKTATTTSLADIPLTSEVSGGGQ